MTGNNINNNSNSHNHIYLTLMILVIITKRRLRADGSPPRQVREGPGLATCGGIPWAYRDNRDIEINIGYRIQKR